MREDITNIAVEDYLTALMPARPATLAQIEAEAALHGWPLIGPVQGQFLRTLAICNGARDVLEIGTATGYAAIWLLMAVAPRGGSLTAIERNPKRVALARQFVEQAGFAAHYRAVEGDYFTTLQDEHAQYDLIFLDMLRHLSHDDEAVRALDLCVPLLRPGGLLVADNVLCNALVLEDDAAPTVRGIQRFNTAIMQHPQLESVILPLRDGVAICRQV